VRLTRLHSLATLLNIIGFTMVYYLVPRHQKRFINEDRFLENLTAVLFICVFALGLFFVARLRDKGKRRAYSAIPLAGLLCFLDEISYGERLFHIKRLPGLRGIKIDGLHDLVYIGFMAIKEDATLTFYAFLSLLLALGLFLVLRHGHRLSDRVKRLLEDYPPLRFLWRAICFLILALLFDLDIMQTRFLSFAEELTEMNVALALLFGAFAMGYEEWKATGLAAQPDS